MDSFSAQKTLNVGGKKYRYADLRSEKLAALGDVEKLPYSLKVLLENLLRNEDGLSVSKDDIAAVIASEGRGAEREIAYRPARVLMQDFTGVPGVVDLAAMRAALAQRGADPQLINPLSKVDLVIDHSVSIDQFGNDAAFAANVKREMERNLERYQFLKWGQGAFNNFSVVPPGTGICHQVNLEYLARVVWSSDESGDLLAYPDTLVGTDSHTTMINGLGVLGWGVGGIEAEAAMLGQPVSMLIPEVVGFELRGELAEGITATDLVLRVVEMLRNHGVVGKFVEFFGAGLDHLTLADRATIANMAPEYGATCGFFPVDERTLEYLALTDRDAETVALVKAYCQAQGLWRSADNSPHFHNQLGLDLASVDASLAGPKRPQDRVALSEVGVAVREFVSLQGKSAEAPGAALAGEEKTMHHGDVVVAAITSCTNTSNPAVMLGAGLLAKKAVEKGLQRQPWVKSSLAPGSKVVTDYLVAAGLQHYLDELGFNLVGYGCTTCIGNSGPLPDNVAATISDNDLVVCSVLSGNRNFEGRIHALVQANWLASPPLVVAYALAGTTLIDFASEPLGTGSDGEPVFLRDLWPSSAEIGEAMLNVRQSMFDKQYASVFDGDETWQGISGGEGATFSFDKSSTYIQLPPFFEPRYSAGKDQPVRGARILALLGDSVTTDHISPAGSIAMDSPAAKYLLEKGVPQSEFNSYGSRRGNHEVMMRGTFANTRIRNELVPGHEGGWTRRFDSDEVASIYDVAMTYQAEEVPTVVFAGKEYGTGSSRDWAAKGTLLLGIKAVIVESFERIHRSNLVGMGVLPLQFPPEVTRQTLKLVGDELIDILGVSADLQPRQELTLAIQRGDGSRDEVPVLCRLDTEMEVAYFLSGGILHYVLERVAAD